MTQPEDPIGQRQIVLCFDGTGNTFRSDGAETNILRICRMLHRTDEQLCYYQPGIGTNITPGSLASTTIRRNNPFSLRNTKAFRQALGESFDQHVLGGYRFLMRHYRAGAKIFIFGFSRGAYTAWFLAEMLDLLGLLGPDNEEVIPFVWNAFLVHKTKHDIKEEEGSMESCEVIRHVRETLCRPPMRVHFLGLFDTVNSIAELEFAARTPQCRKIRHAVSLDERRAKFQPVLLLPDGRRGRYSRHSTWESTPDTHGENCARAASKTDAPEVRDPGAIQDIRELYFPGDHADVGGGWQRGEGETHQLSHVPLVWMVQEARDAGLQFDEEKLKKFHCYVEDPLQALPASVRAREEFIQALDESSAKGHLHDNLQYGKKLKLSSILPWWLMEYLPIKRVRIVDGECKAVRWPIPRGESRSLPRRAHIHRSALIRMQADPMYRPRNLPSIDEGPGQWMPWRRHKGDPVRESFVWEDGPSP